MGKTIRKFSRNNDTRIVGLKERRVMFTIGEIVLMAICFILGAITASLPEIEIITKGESKFEN